MRERIEDLGRIAVLLDQVFNSEVWEIFKYKRPKDAWQIFQELPEEKKEELISSLAYGMRDMESDLSNIYQIARFGDDDD